MWIIVLIQTLGMIMAEFIKRRKLSDAKNVVKVGRDEWLEMKANVERLKTQLRNRK